MDIAPGTTIEDRYEVTRHISQGGMGTVYELRGTILGNRLALKLIHPALAEDAHIRARFEREARVQARLEHPGIVKVFDVVELHGRPGFVMEYVNAPTLRQVMDTKALPPVQVRQFLREILSALATAHGAGIVHRDLKPDNIFVLEDGHGGMHCKLIDFGIAKIEEAQRSTRSGRTSVGDFLGTYRYASPEQIEQTRAVDARSDLYSLGVVAWEMLSGLVPYPDAPTPFRVQTAVVNDALPELPDDIPVDLRRLVMELTRKDPDERPHDAREAMGMLDGSVRIEPTRATRKPAHGHHATAPDPTVVSSPPPPTRTEPTTAIDLPKADIINRALGRAVDEAIALVAVLFCFTVPAYPVLMLRRGRSGQSSPGLKLAGTRLVDATTREPASDHQLMTRNVFDLAFIGLPLVMLAWPAGWFATGGLLPAFGLLWSGCAIALEFTIGLLDPDGRRIADRVAGTRVAAAR